MRTGFLVLAIAAVGCGLRGDMAEAERALPGEIERAKRNGYPMTAEELSPPVLVADDKNGAVIIRMLEEPDLKRKADKYRLAALDARKDASRIDVAALRKAIQEAEPVFAVIERAADAPSWWFNYDYDLSLHLMFPELSQIKEAAKSLSDRAMLHALDGNIQGAVDDLRRIRKVSESLNEQPFLIAALVQIAVSSIQQKALVDIAAKVHNQPRALAALGAFADTEPIVVRLDHAILGEYYMGLSYLRNFDNFGGLKAFSMVDPTEPTLPAPDPSKIVRDGVPNDPVYKAYLARHLQMWNEFAEAKEDFDGDPIAMSNWLDKKSKEIEASKQPSYAVQKVLAPVYTQAGMACLQPLTTARLSRAYISALQTKNRTGSFPASLRTEADPFDGQPLRYKRTAEGFILWSVSNDRKDNGGQRSAPDGGRDYVYEFKG